MSHWESKVVAKAYAAARPQYPKEMHAYIAKFLENAVGTSRSVGATPVTVVDVGCGSGQATGDLATAIGKRAHVIGVDTSKAQIETAQEEEQKVKMSGRDPITFLVSGAEAFVKIVQPHIPHDKGATAPNPQSVVFVAQAMHWFDIPKFADQCRQYHRFVGGGSATTGSWLMACTYLLFRTSNAAVNELILKLDSYLMANNFWPRERKHIDDNYMVLTQQLAHEGFMQVGGVSGSKHEPTATFTYSKPEVTLGGILQYLGTWSGVQRWRDKQMEDRLDGFGDPKDILDQFKDDTIAAMKAEKGGSSNINVDPESMVLGCEFPVSLFIYSDEGRKAD